MPSDDGVSPTLMKRLPLTPIPVDGPFPAGDNTKLAPTTSLDDSRAHSDDELRPSLYQRRKSSVPALSVAVLRSLPKVDPFSPRRTLVKVPYTRRRSQNRRPSPVRNSPGNAASLASNDPTFNSERRTSLPALHFHETVQNATPLRIETDTISRRSSISDDIYGGLKSFTFGAPPTQTQQNSDESDEDERMRRDRAKMRAIDDGTRRPSLPTNDLTPAAPRRRRSFSSVTSSASSSLASSAHIVVGERQWDEHAEPDWDFVMGETTPTVRSPLPATPSSYQSSQSNGVQSEPHRPSDSFPIPFLRRRSRSADELAVDLNVLRSKTPTQLSTSTPLFSLKERHSPEENRAGSSSPVENALDGYDLDFILSQPDADKTNHRLQRQSSASRLRSKFRSKAAKRSHRVEDTFTGHLGQYDPVYERRRREWSFRREVGPGHSPAPQKIKDKEGAIQMSDEQERWRCEWVGIFMVHKFKNIKPNPRAQHPDTSKPMYNRLHIQHMLDSSNKGNKEGGPRVIVHRHSRANAFSIFRLSSQKMESANEGVLMGTKNVLREYTRTESTRALRTYGLIDDEQPDSLNRRHNQHGEIRTSTGFREGSRQHSRSRSERSGPDSEVVTTSDTTRTPAVASASRSTNYKESSGSSSQSQLPEMPMAKDLTATSSPPSKSRLGSISPALSRKSSNSQVSIEPPDHAQQWDISPPNSPRVSTSHAEAFAMRDLDTRHHHHPHPYVAPSISSPPQGQQKVFGLGERFRRAFISSKQSHVKEPASPGTEDEDEPKTANHDGTFAPPWITVVGRAEKEQHERMIRVLNNSFESVGLIPPQEKKKHHKSRQKNKREECAVLEDVPDESMCMLLPLWPSEVFRPDSSSRKARHATSLSVGHQPARRKAETYVMPLEERKYLLVYYTPFVESAKDDGLSSSGNNKKRRRPQTAGERPPQQHGVHDNGAYIGGPSSFAVVARLVGYNDLRSSSIRLPTKGLSITGSLEAAILAIPSISGPGLNSQVIAQCHGPENGVELVQEGLERLGLKDPTAPREIDVNGDPVPVKLSEIGRAVIDMIFCGCVSLMTFSS